MSPLEQIDVIIPTLNAAGSLSTTLAALPPGVAVIVSDGGSTDRTSAIALAAGARVVSGPPGRGQQLAAGAGAATRPWRLFLHADTTLSQEGWAGIVRHIERPEGRGRAASLRLAIDDSAWQARVIERAVALRVRLLGLPYGDQGLLIHRDLYDAVGGYPDQPLMEDVEIMRRLGRARHVVLSGEARTSAARWRRRGWIRQTALNLTCLSLYRMGVPAERIAKLYGR
ncbi:TIGR04283 family arsenosugar biosynthesis glycosyltransferase [Brevundimonas variabilis]|uniref:RSAM/selenodomain-associated transferase 2 n=1 Tax=Brevundimonas variabilis TaxID=74312 RepID=A0A7W9CJW7_9CAUL|nr:rSAM/selenodomain-associated transferase 2 [Brevundimonas variabilis]